MKNFLLKFLIFNYIFYQQPITDLGSYIYWVLTDLFAFSFSPFNVLCNVPRVTC